MKRIIYPSSEKENGIAVIIPTGELALEEVAKKDVPAGVPYIIIDTENLPEDRVFRDAWEADFSTPHGYGIGPDAWFAQQTAKGQT